MNISDGYSDVIYELWTNNNKTTYIATGKQHKIGEYEYTDYKIYKLDGKVYMDESDIVGLCPKGNYMMYIRRDTKKMYFITYNKVVKKEYSLNFTETEKTRWHYPCVEILKESEMTLSFNIYESSDPNSKYETKYETTKYW